MTKLPITDEDRRMRLDDETLERCLRRLRKAETQVAKVSCCAAGRYDLCGLRHEDAEADEALEQLAESACAAIDRLRAHVVARYWQDRGGRHE